MIFTMLLTAAFAISGFSVFNMIGKNRPDTSTLESLTDDPSESLTNDPSETHTDDPSKDPDICGQAAILKLKPIPPVDQEPISKYPEDYVEAEQKPRREKAAKLVDAYLEATKLTEKLKPYRAGLIAIVHAFDYNFCKSVKEGRISPTLPEETTFDVMKINAKGTGKNNVVQRFREINVVDLSHFSFTYTTSSYGKFLFPHRTVTVSDGYVAYG